MKKAAWLVIVFCMIFSTAGCVTRQPLYYSPQGVVPFVSRTMKSPGYWISRLSSPDTPLMGRDAIVRINERIQDDGLIKNIFTVSDVSSDKLANTLKDSVERLRPKGCFLLDGKKASDAFFDRQLEAMNVENIQENAPLRYGLIRHYADQRIFPTEEGLYAVAFDMDFDELQNSTLDIGTPVLIRHQSRDGLWFYVQSSQSDGWVKVENIILVDAQAAGIFSNSSRFVVAASAKTDIYRDPEMTRYYDYVRMGTVLPFAGEKGKAVEIKLPEGFGYLARESVHHDFLVFNQRNVLEQAFKLLNSPYGWGGMYGEQDCSAFILEVFSSFGIRLPRNSKEQAQASDHWISLEGLSDEEKLKKIIQEAMPGVTLLHLKGHIMLYLGNVDGRAYVIHAVWGYRVPQRGGKDKVYVLNRVALSDLSLGEGSKKGSLLQRVQSMSIWKE